MESTTGGDANDEFARWLAETARAEQAAGPAQNPSAPNTAAAPAAQPPVAPPPAPAPAAPAAQAAQPPAPEFFGADELAAAPPTRPYEPQLGGPQVARTSFQAPGETPPAPAYVPPAVLPAAPPTQPLESPQPAAAPERPSWAPGYTAPGGEQAAPPAGPPAAPATPPYQAPVASTAPPAPPTFFPEAQSAPSEASPAPAAPAQPPPAPPSFDLPPAAPAFPPAAPAAAPFPPVAPAPPPTFDLPPAAPVAPPAPVTESPAFPPAAPVSPPAADPFGPLFAAETAVDDTAARLAASPPPSASPPTGELPADEDPLKSLFGLETEEQPAITPDPEPVAAPEPLAYTQEPAPELPTYSPGPEAELPAYVPEPAFAAAAASPAAATASASAGSYALTHPTAPPSDDDPNAGTQFFGGGAGEWEEPPDLDRTTLSERIALILAFLLPPLGLILSIVAAVQSSRERGWVHKIVRASLIVSVILSIVAGFAGAYLYKVLDDARKHDALAAASTQFCATIADRPDMISPPAFGFPAPGASIPDTIASIQEYVDRWDALADVSPSGIRPDVTRVADAARDIVDTVTTSHLVDNDQNVAVMSSVAETTNIVGWAQEYCG